MWRTFLNVWFIQSLMVYFLFFVPTECFGHRQCRLLQVAVFCLFINCVPDWVNFMSTFGQAVQTGGKKGSKICSSYLWRDSHLTYHWHSNHKCLISFSALDGTGLNRFIASVALLWTTNITLKCFSDPTCFNQVQRQSYSLFLSCSILSPF